MKLQASAEKNARQYTKILKAPDRLPDAKRSLEMTQDSREEWMQMTRQSRHQKRRNLFSNVVHPNDNLSTLAAEKFGIDRPSNSNRKAF